MNKELSANTTLSHYRIVSKLGAGGMGEVYLAEDERLRRKVALKVLPEALAHDKDRLRRFEQEAFAASALNHPNILTIYEFGAFSTEAGETHFLAAEFIDGETLRARLQHAPLSLNETLDIAVQIASALAAAHEAHIIHRDIKPENVMLRKDGLVKVLDFGLAKVRSAECGVRNEEPETIRRAEDEGRNEEADTLMLPAHKTPHSALRTPHSEARHSTDPGAVLGTASYMSPEQARGQKVDARTDIFSLGIVLYEMLAGRRPFEGVNMIDVLGAILHEAPAPLAIDAPEELQRIVTKALQKDRTARYGTAQELLSDLKSLQEELAFAAKLSRTPSLNEQATPSPSAFVVPPSGGGFVHTNTPPEGGTTNARFTSRKLAVALVTIAVLASVAAYFFINRRNQPAFAEREPLLLADFENKTGEEIWDGTLKQALAVALEQSPYMNIFPEERARDTLRLMNRSVDDPITRATGREICQRRNVRAMLIGTIAKLERSYTVTLEATNAQSGETIARALEQAAGRDEVVNALGRAATGLRGKLGESLATLQKYDKPLAEATTSSLEALKAYSTGGQLFRSGRGGAVPFLERAVELDSQFASAWRLLGVSQLDKRDTALERAWQLRDRVSELERLGIMGTYFQFVTGDMDSLFATASLATKTYPDHLFGYFLLGNAHASTGRQEAAAEAYREALRLDPDNNLQRNNLARSLMRMNRYEEAEGLMKENLLRQPDSALFHLALFRLVFASGKAVEMERQIEWFVNKVPSSQFQLLQSQTKAFAGQRQQATELFQRAAALAGSRHQIDEQLSILSNDAVMHAYFGLTRKAAEQVTQSLALQQRSQASLRLYRGIGTAQSFFGWTFALSGEAARAQSLTDTLVRENPKDTLILNVIAPLTRATIELQRGNPAQAIELLQPTIQYEAAPASSFRPNWIRAQAYLQLQQGTQAAAEFQKIIDHRGWDVTSPLWSLAHLGLARAAVLQGETAKAKQRYDEFFRLWQDADADLPVLIEAQKEYAKLK